MKLLNKKNLLLGLILSFSIFLAACGDDSTTNNDIDTDNNEGNVSAELQEVTVLLDWTPNTNHTGLFVALYEGYFEEAGLDVTIIQPSDGSALLLMAAGQADFVVSYQEDITYARTSDDPLDVTAIAAVIQHNTSGFASPVDKGIETVADLADKIYGGWGSDIEVAILAGITNIYGADSDSIEIYDIGDMDFFAATSQVVDFTWIYEGWDGVTAELIGEPINFIRLSEIDERLDYYTPVLATNTATIENDPELVSAFLEAVSKGYNYAVTNPEEAVQSLLTYAPETDADIALASQIWLASEYISDAAYWGEMELSTWEGYAEWLVENDLMSEGFTAEDAFTNEFLPQ